MSGLLGTSPTVHVTVVSRSGFSVARGHGVAREGGCTSQSRGGPNPTFLLGIDAGGSMRTGQAMEHGPRLVPRFGPGLQVVLATLLSWASNQPKGFIQPNSVMEQDFPTPPNAGR